MVVLAAALAGCGQTGPAFPGNSYAPRALPALDGDVGFVTYRAVDRLADAAAGRLGAEDTIVVGPVTDLRDPGRRDQDRSNAFGKLVAELVRGRLVQRGFGVTATRPPRTAAVVTGTYTPTPGTTYVSLKLVTPGNGQIIAAVDYAVPRGSPGARLD